MNINNILKKVAVLALPLTLGVGAGTFTSCANMLDTDSEMVDFNGSISTPQDSLYYITGIIRQMQVVADRNVLLGELRSDLMETTDKATKDIKNLAAFNFSEDNAYNRISDYYAIINSCNHYIANADMNLKRLGKVIFEKEFAAVHAYRAWTYLQVAKIYGQVPLVLTPVNTETEAKKAMEMAPSDIKTICEYFIKDIAPYVDTEYPQYLTMNGFESQKFFIPVRVLLADLCLWAGDNYYQTAAEYLHTYLTSMNKPVLPSRYRTYWNLSGLDFTVDWSINTSLPNGWADANDRNIVSLIPMETSEFYGVKSYLSQIYDSEENNNYYYQATPSKALRELSKSQDYCYEAIGDGKRDTIYSPKTGLREELMYGDLRLYSAYKYQHVNQDEYSHYSAERQTISKIPSDFVSIYRVPQIYLMYAEALCRAGYPESAFCILKYGLYDLNIEKYISEKERERAGVLLDFNKAIFTDLDVMGIHAIGCGDVQCDRNYRLPQPTEELASYEDTIQYQIPLLEDMIVTEMALESAFEGHRYYDLMRVALRRNDPAYLAKPVSLRKGTQDNALYNYLMDKKNWYLPVK